MRLSIPLAALALVAAVRTEAATLIVETAESTQFVLEPCVESYTVDSLTLPVGLRYFTGDTVTLTAPDSTSTTPVSSAASPGEYAWTPISGGVWAASNPNEGEDVSFRVWHSLFGLQGAGTEANPAKVVDAGDFEAMLGLVGSAQGFVFAVDGGDVNEFALPAGCGVAVLGDGKYQLVAATDGLLCDGASSSFMLDTEKGGPDRRVRNNDPVPRFAYSGDNWSRTNAAASCVLTFLAPSGAETSSGFTGTGNCEKELDECGMWTVTLSGDGVDTLVAHINRVKTGTVIFVR